MSSPMDRFENRIRVLSAHKTTRSSENELKSQKKLFNISVDRIEKCII